MKKILLIMFIAINISAYAQQWQWAVTADSVFGNQETKMICQSNTNVFALLIQNGPSIINNTYLDSGCVIVNVTTAGQIVWAKHYPGTIRWLYATDSGAIYFVGFFSGVINFGGTVLISHGGKDIFYGKLDAAGNTLWLTTAGGLQDDTGNAIITDSQNNLFFAGQIKDDYFIGTHLLTGMSGVNTYLIRCDLNGNYLSAYADSSGTISQGLKFQKDVYGTLYFTTGYGTYPCPYICGGTNIIKINPVDYSLSVVAEFWAYSFENLWSWAINDDYSVSANFNTGSHYYESYDIYNITSANVRTPRKDLGDGYDGRVHPCITKGIGDEIIAGGYFDIGWITADTLWYDNLFVLPDTLPNAVIGGVDIANHFTWVLRSNGLGATYVADLVSDRQGHSYVAGSYNDHTNWYPLSGLVPDSVSFGTIVLPAQNNYSRFFVAGAESSTTTTTHSEILNPNSEISLTPNPSSGIFTIHSSFKNINTKICVYDLLGNCVLDVSTSSTTSSTEIDLRNAAKGIYFVKVEMEKKMFNQKIIVQ